MKAAAALTAAALALVLSASVAPAQTAEPKPPRKMERKPAEPVKTEDAAAMPTPPPELAQLKYFAGTWRCEGNVPATPLGPARKSRANVTIRPDLDGFYYTGTVREDKSADTPYPVHGIFHETYDAAKKQFLLLWVDNYGGWATQTSAGWAGDTIVMEGEGTMGGQTMGTRDTFVKKTADEMTHVSEVRVKDQWMTSSREICRKTPAAAPAR